MSLLANSNAIETGGYNINNSLRFRRSDSAYLNRTPASASNRKTWTYSAWIKRGQIGAAQVLFSAGGGASPYTAIYFQAADDLVVEYYSAPTNYYIITSQVFRDPSAWYHIVVVWDTTQATSSNRIKIYVNGNQVTSFSTAIYPAQNTDGFINNNTNTAIGSWATVANTFDGYYTETNFIDGQALTPSSFGATDAVTGVWQPAKYTGTYGTNGFYLNFSNIALTSGSNTGLGKDYSGNGNYWNTNNISVTAGTTYDAMTDSPTLTSATVANYAVMNSLNSSVFTGSLTYSNANLTLLASVSCGATSTIFVNSGKWYAEVTVSAITGSPLTTIGIGTNTSQYYAGYSSDSYAYRNDGQKMNNDTPSAYGSSFTTNDVIGIALDMDAGTLTFYKNNVSQGTAYTGLSGTFGFRLGNGGSGSSTTFNINFGQRPFSYTPPTGFNRLNTYNLPDSTIKKGNSYMDATLYTGNGTSGKIVTNSAGFKPDFVWIKDRSAPLSHGLFDSVRGAGYYLISNSTAAQSSFDAQSLQSFNSNGFTVGSTGDYNSNNNPLVGWQWQAGQGTTSTNTAGSISSTVSVNTTAGFSVVTYTGNGIGGATIGHGLGVAPKFIIVKNRASVDDWFAYHVSLGNTKYLRLNTTSASGTSSDAWNNTTPTSTVITLGGFSNVNNSGAMVAYAWAEIAGFSKFDSYTGNGSSDGPFVYLGFRPKYVMIKLSSVAGENWYLLDSARNTYNPEDKWLIANGSGAEGTVTFVDFLSNGFKVRSGSNYVNYPSQTFIFAAFAENPFKNALAR